MEDKILSFYLDDLPHDYSWIAAPVVVMVVMVVIVGVVCHQRSSHPATCKPAKDVSVDKTDMRYVWSDGNDLCTHDWRIFGGGCGQSSCPHHSMSPFRKHHEE